MNTRAKPDLSRIAVDVGGTFTDLVLWEAGEAELRVGKALTTPDALETGVAALLASQHAAGHVEHSEYFMHGTTVALNALLQRRGGRLALIGTAGFRDVLEMRRGERDAMNDLRWVPSPPLVPRRLRLSVRERLDPAGSVIVPLCMSDVEAVAEVLAREQIETVAIALLHAYANPRHELEVAAKLRELGFEGEVSLSHEISREFREYERTATTVTDAYVRPIMAGYLDRLESELRALDFGGESLVTASGGGAMAFAEARRRPVETIMSGPVGGVVGAAALCASLGIRNAITADVGGTSFDTCLVLDGEPEVKFEGRIDGVPIQTKWVDVRSVGAGGGSLAWVDQGGLLRAGPHSAGADPGPAAYGRGGTGATATDAALVLGMLGPGRLAGGVELDIDLARRALAEVGRSTGMDVERVAQGVLVILTASMANAIRGITIERGRDPRDMSLVCYGGAGPLFGGLTARKLGIREIVVPRHAGNFSAWGLLNQDVVTTAALTKVAPLSRAGLTAASEAYADLAESLARRAREQGHQTLVDAAHLDLRFLGQEHTLTVPAPELNGGCAKPADSLLRRFLDLYERTYGHLMDEGVEIVTIRAEGRRRLPRPPLAFASRESQPVRAEDVSTAPVFSFARGSFQEFRIVDQSGVPPGERVLGPAVLLDDTSTTYLDVGMVADVLSSGILVISDEL